MICKKCGNKLEDEDLYCPECGTKINKNDNNISKKIIRKSKNKKILFILMFIIVACISGVGYFFNQPKTINIEAEQLSKIINKKEEKKYMGDNMVVHGYLQKVPYQKDYYLIYSKDNITDMVMFNVKNELSDDLGDGSEITVTGKLSKLSEADTIFLEGNNIVIHEKKENVIDAGFTDDVIENANSYNNKKISVIGKLVITNMSGAYITDEKIVNDIWLYGISNQELYEYHEGGPWVYVTGTFTMADGKCSIKVDKIEKNEITTSLDEEVRNKRW